MTSESPTHPDAPRAGGETPDMLPCPFCGADEASGDVQTVRADGAYTINCWRCGARSPSEGVWNDAAAAWNRRAALPSLLARHRDGAADDAKLEAMGAYDEDVDGEGYWATDMNGETAAATCPPPHQEPKRCVECDGEMVNRTLIKRPDGAQVWVCDHCNRSEVIV